MSSAEETGGTVLLVDDEEAIRHVFKFMLTAEIPGLKVLEASNGSEALASISGNHPQVVIMDLHMPVMDGLAAFKELRRRCEAQGIRMPHVIFCTGFAPPQAVLQIVREGQGHVLMSKPVKTNVLISAVRDRLTAA